MKKDRVREKFLDELRRTPIILVACEKVGISRNSVYTWMKKDPAFLRAVDDAMQEGTGLVNDVAESNVLNGIKAKDAGYTKYWLSNKHKDYKRPYIVRNDERDPLVQYALVELAHARKQLLAMKDKKSPDEIAAAKKRIQETLIMHGVRDPKDPRNIK